MSFFLNHVMAQAPGYAQLLEQATAPILPTPVAVGKIMTELAGAINWTFSVWTVGHHRCLHCHRQ